MRPWRACAARAAPRSSWRWCAPDQRCRWSSPWSARRWKCTASRWSSSKAASSTRASPTFSETTALDFAAGVARLRRDLGARPRGVITRPAQQPGRRARIRGRSRRPAARDGVIVTADGRTPAARFSMAATPGEVLTGVPVVVLVNGATASAAEILAGALQDHRPRHAVGPAHLRQGLGADGDAADAADAPSSSPPRVTTRRRAAPSRAAASSRTSKFETIDAAPVDLEDPRVRQTLAARDAGVRAGARRAARPQAAAARPTG